MQHTQNRPAKSWWDLMIILWWRNVMFKYFIIMIGLYYSPLQVLQAFFTLYHVL